MGCGVGAARHVFSYNATVNRLREKLGLGPIDDLLGNNSKCDHMMIGLYEELMPPCPTWTDIDHTYIGPCLPNTDVQLSDDLEAFLVRGSKPIYIGFGSMRHANSEQLTAKLLKAVSETGVRAIIAQNASEIGSDLEASENVFVLRGVPDPSSHSVSSPQSRRASRKLGHHAPRGAGGHPAAGAPPGERSVSVVEHRCEERFGAQGRRHESPQGEEAQRGDRATHAGPAYEANARALAQRVAGKWTAPRTRFGCSRGSKAVSGRRNGSAWRAPLPGCRRRTTDRRCPRWADRTASRSGGISPPGHRPWRAAASR